MVRIDGGQQVAGAVHLRAEDRGEALRREVAQQPVVEDAGGVDHAPQRRAIVGGRAHHRLHGGGIGDIDAGDAHVGAALPDPGQRVGDLRRRRPPPAQHQAGGAAVGQLPGDGEPEATQAAGDDPGAAGGDVPAGVGGP